MRESSNNETRIPARSPRLFRLFRWYGKRCVARHFHAVRISRSGPIPDLPRRPTIVVLNHPSWWDPLLCVILSEVLPAWQAHFGPIEAVGLSQYPFLARIGFFGFDTGTAAGASRFLRTSLSILARPESVLWLTAQGEFVDARQRPMVLRPGIGHLAHHLSDAIILPMAIEYPFWIDRCPEVLIRFGGPIEIEDGRIHSPREWTATIARTLEEQLDALSSEARSRDPDAFVTLFGGTSGVGGVYDVWRRIRAALGGTSFQAEHRARRKAGDGSRPVPLALESSDGRNTNG